MAQDSDVGGRIPDGLEGWHLDVVGDRCIEWLRSDMLHIGTGIGKGLVGALIRLTGSMTGAGRNNNVRAACLKVIQIGPA
ncbi:hypothetical protein GCM10016234_35190 [Tianweitania populi]|uniref:Uncharacterized protein n=1 Tax=Tianweitania populi TaxID=1607949 RepID=A0A8J3E086_9HYPH|nr:hypothetical protein GCM10016234_35190 [Tianweitania populi]